ncbi:hypothetical protein SOPP22_00735 [Shewanella sp. OPT22]|nr:hypothetical protein SOPP22_00735 [Shewanella sp. OPT22]
MKALEKFYRLLLLLIGITGIIVLYAGNLFLLFDGAHIDPAMLFFLPCPIICLFFGLAPKNRVALIKYFSRKHTIKA